MLDAEKIISRILSKPTSTVDQLLALMRTRAQIPITATDEALYGVPIYIYGEEKGFVGQFIGKTYVNTSEGLMWIVQVGRVSFYACIDDKRRICVPVIEFGLPTVYGIQYFLEGKITERNVFLHQEVWGTVEFFEKDIVNLKRVLEGKDPILIVDKYGILRRGTPEEFIEKEKELLESIIALEESVRKYEMEVNELRAAVKMVENQNRVLRNELIKVRERYARLVTEMVALFNEMEVLREEYARTLNRLKLAESDKETLMALFDKLFARYRHLEKLTEKVEVEEKGGKR